MTKKTTTEQLIADSLELDAIKEELKNCEDFIRKIVSYDDLPPSDMVLDTIIKDAKTFAESKVQEGDLTDEDW